MAVRTYDPKTVEIFKDPKCSFPANLVKWKVPEGMTLEVSPQCTSPYTRICARCNLAFCDCHADPIYHSCSAPLAHWERKRIPTDLTTSFTATIQCREAGKKVKKALGKKRGKRQ